MENLKHLTSEQIASITPECMKLILESDKKTAKL